MQARGQSDSLGPRLGVRSGQGWSEVAEGVSKRDSKDYCEERGTVFVLVY